jgi:phosphotransferase system enzyme I (PtsP)
MQYMFAADRGNPRINTRYDALSPPMLTMFRHLVEVCEAAGVPISVCGEMAGRPLDAMTLLGVGFRSLSMSPPAVGPVKTMLRSLNVSQLRAYIETLYPGRDHSLREKLRSYAIDHGVVI